MELGNLIFGHSRGKYELHNRGIADSKEWVSMLEKAQVDPYGISEMDGCGKGFDNEVFTIRPYYWGDCTCGAVGSEGDTEHKDDCELVKPNFVYKPTGFEIQWYKYPFRDSYMNQNLSDKEILSIFRECVKSL